MRRKWWCLQRCCSAMDTLGVWVWLSYAAAAISAAAVLYVLWGRPKRRRNLPPGPPGVPLLGNLLQLQLGNKPNETLAALAAKYGPLMTLRLGMRTTMVVSSGSIAKQIFKTHDHVFAGRTVPHAAEALEHCKGSIGFAQQGPHLRMVRRISTTHLFTRTRIESMQPLRQRKLLQMIRRVLTCSSSSSSRAGGGLVDVWQTVLQCTVDLMGNMVFGRDMPWEMEQFKELTWELLLLYGLPNIADFFPFLRPLDPQRLQRRAAKAFAQFNNMLDPFIHEALRQRDNDNTSGLLSALWEARDDEDDNLTLHKIRDFLTDMFLAGTGTLATTVEWAMAELMKNPEVMRKVQQELDAVVGRHRLVEEEDIEKLPYLKAVMKETFRLHPAAPLLPHRADEAVQVCGYDIPRHTAVVVNLWAIGRDKGAWQQPHCFWPERFQGSHIDFRGQHFELIPFGAGRRICVGLSLGDIFVHIILAHLLHCFEWSLPDGIGPAELDMSDKFSLSLQKAQPLLLHASPRLPLHLYSSSS